MPCLTNVSAGPTTASTPTPTVSDAGQVVAAVESLADVRETRDRDRLGPGVSAQEGRSAGVTGGDESVPFARVAGHVQAARGITLGTDPGPPCRGCAVLCRAGRTERRGFSPDAFGKPFERCQRRRHRGRTLFLRFAAVGVALADVGTHAITVVKGRGWPAARVVSAARPACRKYSPGAARRVAARPRRGRTRRLRRASLGGAVGLARPSWGRRGRRRR